VDLWHDSSFQIYCRRMMREWLRLLEGEQVDSVKI
jgi:hypothetical protein